MRSQQLFQITVMVLTYFGCAFQGMVIAWYAIANGYVWDKSSLLAVCLLVFVPVIMADVHKLWLLDPLIVCKRPYVVGWITTVAINVASVVICSVISLAVLLSPVYGPYMTSYVVLFGVPFVHRVFSEISWRIMEYLTRMELRFRLKYMPEV